jgi:hypothetical protein
MTDNAMPMAAQTSLLGESAREAERSDDPRSAVAREEGAEGATTEPDWFHGLS